MKLPRFRLEMVVKVIVVNLWGGFYGELWLGIQIRDTSAMNSAAGQLSSRCEPSSNTRT
jgi:hypothetical protein